MEVVYERCCGLDIHKQTVVACVVVPGAGKQPRKEIRTFNTMTADLLALADWLTAQGVMHVALESNWSLLEAVLEPARGVLQTPKAWVYGDMHVRMSGGGCGFRAAFPDVGHTRLRSVDLVTLAKMDEDWLIATWRCMRPLR